MPQAQLAERAAGWTSHQLQDVGGELQAVVHLPVRVPLGFHGNWIADAR